MTDLARGSEANRSPSIKKVAATHAVCCGEVASIKGPGWDAGKSFINDPGRSLGWKEVGTAKRSQLIHSR